MFHVANMMPLAPNDPQQVRRAWAAHDCLHGRER